MTRRTLVLDSWPLTALIASGYGRGCRGQMQERLLELCRAGAIDLSFADLEPLALYLTTAQRIVTTPVVVGEAFSLLERAAGTGQMRLLIEWVHEHFIAPTLKGHTWSNLLGHEIAVLFGLGDASAVEAAQRTGGELIVQDGRLFDWCLRHHVPVRSCLDIIGWSPP